MALIPPTPEPKADELKEDLARTPTSEVGVGLLTPDTAPESGTIGGPELSPATPAGAFAPALAGEQVGGGPGRESMVRQLQSGYGNDFVQEVLDQAVADQTPVDSNASLARLSTLPETAAPPPTRTPTPVREPLSLEAEQVSVTPPPAEPVTEPVTEPAAAEAPAAAPTSPAAETPSETAATAGGATEEVVGAPSTEAEPEATEVGADAAAEEPATGSATTAEAEAGEMAAADREAEVSAEPTTEEGGPGAPAEGEEKGAAGEAPTESEVPAEAKAPTSPAEDPAFQTVVARAKKVAYRQGHNNPAMKKAAEAQAAAKGPPNELQSQAADAQVQKMDAQEPAPFDRASFKAALLDKIAAITPRNLEEADEFKKSNKAASLKGAVVSKVDSGKEGAQSGIEGATTEAPDPSVGTPKEVVPQPSTEPGPAPGTIGGAQAAPKRKTDAEVSLDAGSQSLDQQLEEDDITEEQLMESNETEFQEAVAKKNEAQTDAKEAPVAYRADEGGLVAGAEARAAAGAAAEVAGMHGVRGVEFSAISGKQDVTRTEDEAKRAEVSQTIETIYQETKSKVEARLQQLDEEVNQIFDAGAEAARVQFESYVDQRMRAYKRKRYSGATGLIKWGKDKLFGMPDEVNAFYQEGRDLYIQAMDAVIDEVATAVETGLNDAMEIIAAGRRQIQEYVANLPADLAEVGKNAAADIQARFDSLKESVNSKRDQLIDSLAQKYADNLKAIDARIEKMKAANRGLVDAAFDAIAGVIATIIELKNMLLGVLAKAAGVIGKILKDPIGFVGNLVAGVAAGLQNFVANIGTHLQKGLMGWLFGALAEAGIQMPESFDLKGILSLVLQVLGLTYANIRARAVAILGEPLVSRLEQVAEVFKILITQGPAGLWQYIKDKVGDLKSMIIDGIKSFVIEKVIVAGITWVVSLLNPASAFIKACKAIYDIVMFFVTRASQIMALVNAVLDSVAAIAGGAIGVAAAAVENALSKAVPVVISFLASLLGLGGISQKIRSIIMKIQAPINKAIDWVINKAVALVKAAGKLFAGGNKKKDQDKETDDPEHDAKLTAGKAAIDQEEQKYLEEGKISRENAERVATTVKQQHPVFKTLVVIDGGQTWNYDFTASPGEVKTGEKKGDGEEDLPYKVGDKVFIFYVDEEELGIMDEVNDSYDPPLVFFKIESGRRKGSRFGVPKQKVINKEGIRDYVGHDSKYVVGNKLDSKYSSNVRGRFYPSGYRVNAQSWLEDRLKHLENPSNPSQFKDEIAGTWAAKSEATIDHVTPVVTHWNAGAAGFGPGNDATQKQRADFYNTTSNMQAATRSSNAAKGGSGNYTPVVGPNFRGPGE